MTLQRCKMAVLTAALGMCMSHSALAAPKAAAVLDFDDPVEENYAEVPVESFQQFVQITKLGIRPMKMFNNLATNNVIILSIQHSFVGLKKRVIKSNLVAFFE